MIDVRTVTEYEIHDVKISELDDFLEFCTLENIEPLNIRFKHIAGTVMGVIITVKYPVLYKVEQLSAKFDKFKNIGDVSADYFVELVYKNIDNPKLNSLDVYNFIVNTLPIVRRKSKRENDNGNSI